MSYEVIYPDGLADDDYWEIEEKGWVDVEVAWLDTRTPLSFVSSERLAQEIDRGLKHKGFHSIGPSIVVSSVNREQIDAAVARLVENGFTDLVS